MKARHSEHKIRARRADLRAVLQQPDMPGGRVLAAHFQTMIDRFETNRVARLTRVNALARIRINMGHDFFLRRRSQRARCDRDRVYLR